MTELLLWVGVLLCAIVLLATILAVKFPPPHMRPLPNIPPYQPEPDTVRRFREKQLKVYVEQLVHEEIQKQLHETECERESQ